MLTYFVPDSYLIADNVIFLVITDKSYPRKLAFSYLDELSKEFQLSYGAKVDTVRKPYAFVGFGMYPSDCAVSGRSPLTLVCADTFMSKTTRLYQDTRTASAAGASHLDKLNDELQDVTRIMTKNMEELLWRGDSLDSKCHCLRNIFASIRVYTPHFCSLGMSHLSTTLRSESEKYRRAARNINIQAMIRQYAPIGAIVLLLIIFIYWRFS